MFVGAGSAIALPLLNSSESIGNQSLGDESSEALLQDATAIHYVSGCEAN